jgi:hypothetical protein
MTGGQFTDGTDRDLYSTDFDCKTYGHERRDV